MLGSKLREEFQGKLLKGTAIELANDCKTDANQVGAQSFLGITYPTHDLVKAITAIGPNHDRPVVVVAAGLDTALDALLPANAESWLVDVLKPATLSFQQHFGGGGRPAGLYHKRIT